MISPNQCVQATPDCALLFVIAQVCGAPDAERYVTKDDAQDQAA